MPEHRAAHKVTGPLYKTIFPTDGRIHFARTHTHTSELNWIQICYTSSVRYPNGCFAAHFNYKVYRYTYNCHCASNEGIQADSDRRAVESVVLRPLDCCNRGFESRWRHGFLSLVFVVSYVGSGLCYGLITIPEDSYCVCGVCVCLIMCDVETTKMRLPRRDLGCYAKGRKKERKR